ncbi:MAG: hypothetical protein SF051_15585 [Elusimicrobiota bacterium]|nr:hypothetical protein [Elusimicrobiota bacterium]
MKTITPSLFVSAALAGLLAAASTPAFADHHEGGKKDGHKDHKAKKEKKDKGMKGKKADAAEKVSCMGVNACKGKGECGVDGKHGCAGQNACKGQGWVTLARKACDAKKGTVVGGHGAAPEQAGMTEAPAAPAAPVAPEAKGNGKKN